MTGEKVGMTGEVSLYNYEGDRRGNDCDRRGVVGDDTNAAGGGEGDCRGAAAGNA